MCLYLYQYCKSAGLGGAMTSLSGLILMLEWILMSLRLSRRAWNFWTQSSREGYGLTPFRSASALGDVGMPAEGAGHLMAIITSR